MRNLIKVCGYFLTIFMLSSNISYADNYRYFDQKLNTDFLGTIRLYDKKGRIYDFDTSKAFSTFDIGNGYKMILNIDEFKKNVSEIDKMYLSLAKKDGFGAVAGDDGKYVINKVPAKVYKVDSHKLMVILSEKLLSGDYSIAMLPFSDEEIEVPYSQVVLLGEYTTQYNSGMYNRSSNIVNAGLCIGGTKVKVGEIFSFNKKIDEVSYKMLNAPVIVGDKLAQGIGGGLCQASTTLFNAVYESGLEIVERSNHTLAQGYIARGRDAMVSSWSDFKFKNNFENDIYIIYRQSTNNSITMQIYGDIEDKKDVKTSVYRKGGNYILNRNVNGAPFQSFGSRYKN